MNQGMREYHDTGFCLTRNLFSPTEILKLLNESQRLWDQYKSQSTFNVRTGYRKLNLDKQILERLDPVADISSVFARVNADSRLIQMAEEALGESVLVMKEKLIYKWPGTSGYGAHRDEPYFASCGAQGKEMVSISIALDASTAHNGAIIVYPHSRLLNLSPPKNEPRDIDYSELNNAHRIMPLLNAGDAIVFDGLVPHCSDINRSDHARRTYTVTFVPARYRQARLSYYKDRADEIRSKQNCPID